MPAPTSPNSGACSSTRTRRPRRVSAKAAPRPPMPPPTTITSGFMVSPGSDRALQPGAERGRVGEGVRSAGEPRGDLGERPRGQLGQLGQPALGADVVAQRPEEVLRQIREADAEVEV